MISRLCSPNHIKCLPQSKKVVSPQSFFQKACGKKDVFVLKEQQEMSFPPSGK